MTKEIEELKVESVSQALGLLDGLRIAVEISPIAINKEGVVC